jgi:hypothetical protein
LLGEGRQAGSDIDPSGNPAFAFVEQSSDLELRAAVVLFQRTDHTGLIESGQGAHRGIGYQHEAFMLLRGARPLDSHGYVLGAVLYPTSQAFESINDLEGTTVGRYHPYRQIDALVRWVTGDTGSKRGIAGPQLVSGHKLNGSGT